MQAIGFSGASGSGKNKAARILADLLLDGGFSSKLDAFALPIKKRIMERKAEQGLPAVIDKEADRLEMQRMGAAFRAADADYFILTLARRNNLYRECSDRTFPEIADFLIVPDVRYPNEAEFIKKHGVLIHVCGCKNPLQGGAAEHESESHFEELYAGADYAIAEQPTLERLAAAVKRMLDIGAHLKK